MDMHVEPFAPPAPIPHEKPLSRFQMVRTIMRNPIELWGEPSYTLPWFETRLFGKAALIVNDPGLIRHILVDNVANYRMSDMRQMVLRPILRDGLLTAEGAVWKRSRKAVAPVFTPRHAQGFADQMLRQSELYVEKYRGLGQGGRVIDITIDMAELTVAILADTLFSGDVDTATGTFAEEVNELLHRMGRVDPMDILRAPPWVPRLTHIRGRRVLAKFRKTVSDAMHRRLQRMKADPTSVPQDFLTLLLAKAGPDGLTMDEIEDNILTFIGAGHETTARALAWTLFCVANVPAVRDEMEEEIDRVLATGAPPIEWLERMPHVRAAFEEGMRLYPPAPSINRAAVGDDSWTSPSGERVDIAAEKVILIMPWTLHRHALYWEKPRAFLPERFLPENRARIGRFQYLPFGAGPRVCIGATFAMQEAVIALAVLMSRFRFDVTDETHPWPVQKLTTQPRDGLPMRVSERVG